MLLGPEQKGRSTDHLQIVSNECSTLPEFGYVVELLTNLATEIQNIPNDNETFLLNFYYPLLAIVYLLGKTALSRLELFPASDEKTLELRIWFFKFILAVGEVIEIIVSALNPELDDIYDQLLIAYLDEFHSHPHQWNSVTLTWIAQWVVLMISKENHRGNPPFYIYIGDVGEKKFPPNLPRVLEGKDWLSGFGGRFLVLPGALKLTDSEKAELWNRLLVGENIYGNKKIDHSVRIKVFQAIFNHFPLGEIQHLDLCGGKGDFIEWLQKHGSDAQSFLIDNADKAVAVAQERNITAFVGSAEKALQIEQPVDVITIIFAIQWISPNAFNHVMLALKPGGILIANIYPPDQERIDIFTQILHQAGFIDIQHEEIDVGDGKKQFILWAKKTEDT